MSSETELDFCQAAKGFSPNARETMGGEPIWHIHGEKKSEEGT
jgi:hypothetical protein